MDGPFLCMLLCLGSVAALRSAMCPCCCCNQSVQVTREPSAVAAIQSRSSVWSRTLQWLTEGPDMPAASPYSIRVSNQNKTEAEGI